MTEIETPARTRFELLFDESDVHVALWLVSHWRSTSRANDENLHRATRAMIDRGELTKDRWRNILDEAEQFDRSFVPEAKLRPRATVDDIDLAITAGVPLTDGQADALRFELASMRKRGSVESLKEAARLQGLLSRAIGIANGAAAG
ncbi:MAG: hypothetical protein R3E75_08135 [Steroidobacteraceae bacterium]|nr:hypothetical protein [Nevskiaceae bacterium]MCP5359882.1 hypothetical protein [Nevskiaceae bacterium]MCP5467023.1 hypothetical protein [Nevskiaceae bacterium]MCP5472298.1 hypothetical protein [Nevskiaceae bacterium]